MAPGNNWAIDANHALNCSLIVAVEKRTLPAGPALVLVTTTSTAGMGPALIFPDATSRDAFFTLVTQKIT